MYPIGNLFERKFSGSEALRWSVIPEVMAVVTLIMIQIWGSRSMGRLPIFTAAAIIIAGWFARKETCKELGLVNRWLMLIPAGILGGKFLAVNFPFDRNGLPGVALGLIGYFGWAWLQQLALNGFLVRRCAEAGMAPAVIACSAGITAGIIHLPNPLLVPVSCLGAGAASYLFLRMRRKNLYWLALGHAVIGVALLHAVPASFHHHFLIGPSFWSR